MAEVKVEKKGTEQRNQQEPQGLERRQQGITRGRESFPSLWRSPSEFFSMSPFALMRRFSDEMDRAFSNTWSGFGTSEAGGWSPAIDVSEREGKLMVHADLPGMNKEDVKIEVTGDGLILRGERKREHEESGRGFHRSERSYGSFYRYIPLPEGAQIEEARAQFNNGVLEVSVPVPQEQSRRREIPIEVGGAERKEASSETSAARKREAKAAG